MHHVHKKYQYFFDTINLKSIIKYGKSKRELIKKYRIYEIV